MKTMDINSLLDDIEFTINNEDYSAYVDLVYTLVNIMDIDGNLRSKIIDKISLLMLYSRLSKDVINGSAKLCKGEIVVDNSYKEELSKVWVSLQNLIINYNLKNQVNNDEH